MTACMVIRKIYASDNHTTTNEITLSPHPIERELEEKEKSRETVKFAIITSGYA